MWCCHYSRYLTQRNFTSKCQCLKQTKWAIASSAIGRNAPIWPLTNIFRPILPVQLYQLQFLSALGFYSLDCWLLVFFSSKRVSITHWVRPIRLFVTGRTFQTSLCFTIELPMQYGHWKMDTKLDPVHFWRTIYGNTLMERIQAALDKHKMTRH